VADNRPDVELRIPADGAFLSARLDFTLDDIEDLRIAVDEACAVVLPQARPESDLRCAFYLAPETLKVEVSAHCDAPRPPHKDGFAWTVLSALTSTLDAEVDGDTLTVTLSRTSGETG
jgi:serine/threonine-protein kinase RsbW